MSPGSAMRPEGVATRRASRRGASAACPPTLRVLPGARQFNREPRGRSWNASCARERRGLRRAVTEDKIVPFTSDVVGHETRHRDHPAQPELFEIVLSPRSEIGRRQGVVDVHRLRSRRAEVPNAIEGAARCRLIWSTRPNDARALHEARPRRVRKDPQATSRPRHQPRARPRRSLRDLRNCRVSSGTTRWRRLRASTRWRRRCRSRHR